MIIVTGGAGFIGSNVVKALNDEGHDRILVVDEVIDKSKAENISDLKVVDCVEKNDFLRRVQSSEDFGQPDAIFHQGACSDTTEWNGRFMMQNNFEYSKALLHYCMQKSVPYIYASSASVYGSGAVFSENPANECPINLYAFSKYLFDQYVRRYLPSSGSQIVGLRYFNVYGPREQHKGKMASVAWHFDRQIAETGQARLFTGSGGYSDGEQRRDFIYVGDAAAVNLWFLDHPDISDIFNLGTGRSQTFNDVAHAVIDYHGTGSIEYIPFPRELEGRYQSFTEADMSALRAAGYDHDFCSVEQGVESYLEWLHR